ncbi:hypothetical protein BJ912DRAFT_485018 [Pholiota molesta]|nr:hypothetical protein BJ912DRAFT_485018 [Pholiota molesta]
MFALDTGGSYHPLRRPSIDHLSASDFAHQLRSPSYISGLLKRSEVGRIGVHGLQGYGLFKIGDIVGRRRVFGYILDETSYTTSRYSVDTAHMPTELPKDKHFKVIVLTESLRAADVS